MQLPGSALGAGPKRRVVELFVDSVGHDASDELVRIWSGYGRYWLLVERCGLFGHNGKWQGSCHGAATLSVARHYQPVLGSFSRRTPSLLTRSGQRAIGQRRDTGQLVGTRETSFLIARLRSPRSGRT